VTIVAKFHFVCLAWIFFRAPTFAHATLALQRIAGTSWTIDHVTPKVLVAIGAGLVLHFLPKDWDVRARETFVRTPALVQGLVLAAVAMGLHVASSAKPEPFVYGQF
jgi:hypothetical protein